MPPLGCSTWRPRYIPVFRSTWWRSLYSPVCWSSWKLTTSRRSCERRWLRRDGDVFRLGTAMILTFQINIRHICRPQPFGAGWIPALRRNIWPCADKIKHVFEGSDGNVNFVEIGGFHSFMGCLNGPYTHPNCIFIRIFWSVWLFMIPPNLRLQANLCKDLPK